MSIDIPDDYYIITREGKMEDQELTEAKKIMDVEELQGLLEPDNVYLYAFDHGGYNHIIVVMMKNVKDIWNLNGLEDDEIIELLDFGEESATIRVDSVYRNESLAFSVINSDLGKEEIPYYQQAYSTVVNGQGINIILRSYVGPLSAKQEELLLNTVNSISFSSILPEPNPFLRAFGRIDWWEAIREAIRTGIIAALVCGLLSFFLGRQRKKTTRD